MSRIARTAGLSDFDLDGKFLGEFRKSGPYIFTEAEQRRTVGRNGAS